MFPPPYLYPFLALPSALHYLVPSANKCLPPTYLHLSPSSLLFSASFWLFLSLSHALSLSISLSLSEYCTPHMYYVCVCVCVCVPLSLSRTLSHSAFQRGGTIWLESSQIVQPSLCSCVVYTHHSFVHIIYYNIYIPPSPATVSTPVTHCHHSLSLSLSLRLPLSFIIYRLRRLWLII